MQTAHKLERKHARKTVSLCREMSNHNREKHNNSPKRDRQTESTTMTGRCTKREIDRHTDMSVTMTERNTITAKRETDIHT